MRSFLKKFAVSTAIGVVFTALLGVVAASAYPSQTQEAIVTIVTTTSDIIAPDPTPEPTPITGSSATDPTPVVEPTVVPTVIPTPVPVGPTSFPSAPPQLVVPTPGAAPTLMPVPQTMVTISVSPCTGDNFDVDTGGCKGVAPFEVTYTANFQGGFSGVAPKFIWSDGQVGQTIKVTYGAGVHRISVKVQQVYQGHTYEAGAANSVAVTVS